jgi:hypothetical protein
MLENLGLKTTVAIVLFSLVASMFIIGFPKRTDDDFEYHHLWLDDPTPNPFHRARPVTLCFVAAVADPITWRTVMFVTTIGMLFFSLASLYGLGGWPATLVFPFFVVMIVSLARPIAFADDNALYLLVLSILAAIRVFRRDAWPLTALFAGIAVATHPETIPVVALFILWQKHWLRATLASVMAFFLVDAFTTLVFSWPGSATGAIFSFVFGSGGETNYANLAKASSGFRLMVLPSSLIASALALTGLIPLWKNETIRIWLAAFGISLIFPALHNPLIAERWTQAGFFIALIFSAGLGRLVKARLDQTGPAQ